MKAFLPYIIDTNYYMHTYAFHPFKNITITNVVNLKKSWLQKLPEVFVCIHIGKQNYNMVIPYKKQQQ